VLRSLSESDARIHADPLAGDPGANTGLDAGREVATDLADHIRISRIVLHAARLATHVHQADRRARRRRRLECSRCFEGAHVVDHAGAGRDGLPHHLGLARVHRECHADATREGLEHRQYAPEFLTDRDRRRSGSRGLTPDIDDGSALLGHAHTVRDGRVHGAVTATVGE
jgi:hypothetical protein